MDKKYFWFILVIVTAVLFFFLLIAIMNRTMGRPKRILSRKASYTHKEVGKDAITKRGVRLPQKKFDVFKPEPKKVIFEKNLRPGLKYETGEEVPLAI